MKLIAIPLEFIAQDGIVKAKYDFLLDKVVKFMERHMGCCMPLADMQKVWVAVEVDETHPIESKERWGRVHGILPMRFVADIPGMRFLDRESANMLIDRIRFYLQDNGASGRDVFVYIKDGDDPHRCNGYREVLESQAAEPGERWVVKV